MRSSLAAAFVICFIPAVQAADIENPFKNAKVGQWAEYKLSAAGLSGTTKMTIIAKDDKEVTYEVSGSLSIQGTETAIPAHKQTIDLTKPFDLLSATNLKAKNVKVEQDSEGKEKIKVGNKEYDTKWVKLKVTATIGAKTVASEYKMWFSKDVPVSGMVKMETTSGPAAITMELTGSGSK